VPTKFSTGSRSVKAVGNTFSCSCKHRFTTKTILNQFSKQMFKDLITQVLYLLNIWEFVYFVWGLGPISS